MAVVLSNVGITMVGIIMVLQNTFGLTAAYNVQWETLLLHSDKIGLIWQQYKYNG